MKKHFLKSFALIAMLFSALTVSAGTELFNPATTTISEVFIAYPDWEPDGVSSATYDANTGVISVDIKNQLNGQWKGQVKLQHDITFAAGKKYQCSMKFRANTAVNRVTLKIDDNTGMIFEDQAINIPANEDYVYTSAIVDGAAGNNKIIVFDFGWAPACQIVISDISIQEVEPTPEPEAPTVYCNFPTGHLNNADFGDANGRCLLTLTKISDKEVRVTVKPNYANGATKKMDYLYVISSGGTPYPAEAGADAAEGGYDELSVDITYASAPTTYSFTIQWSNVNDGGRWQLTPENITPEQLCTEAVEIEDVNFALTSNGSSAEATSGDAAQAIDNNAGSRWESASADPQTWTLDLGQARIFNTLEIVWEGAYGKTFTVSVSDDKATWTPVWTVEGQELAGFPYTQTQKIDKTTARYIQFHGTERGTGYGYSFYEFRVYLAGVSTFTSLEAKPATNLTKVGEGNAITLTAKDQNGKTMTDVGEVTYTITPAGAGTITNNVYTPARIGLASIVATIGEVSAPAFEVFAYDGENVALSPDINNSKIIAQSEFAPSGTDAWHAIDGNEGNEWQGSATNGTTDDEAARTYDSWFVVDFGAEYDVNLVSINFEGACSQEYHVDFSADNVTWSLAYNYVGNAGINGHTKLIYGNDLKNSTKVRYARFYSTKAATQYGMKIHEFKVFGTESATLTKAVSASVNDAAMGTATVTQDGVAVTEVETGSEVTFTAVANEGYAFVNWSDGNTNPSFTTTVNAAMHLTANFRALGNIYCNTEMTVDGHTIYVTMKRSAPETYQLIVRSEENLTNFGGTNFYRSNNIHVIDLRDQGVLSEDKHILTATFNSETAPYMGTPLYVVFEGVGERTYPQLDNIEYDVECSEDITITGLAINPASVSIMVGGSQTLKPLFTPAHAFTNELEWTSSNESVATVDANGVITAVASGDAVITAKLISNPAITATCNVTVTNFTAHTFYGYGSQNGVDFAYSLTNNANGTVTIVADVLTNNPGLGVISFSIDEDWDDMTKNADGTYTRTSEKTFSMGQEVHCFLHAPYTGGVGRLDFDYIIGSSNERPNVAVTSVTLDKTSGAMLIGETLQLTAIFNPGTATNKAVSWSSDNTTVAEVNANGLVTAKAEGTATITVTTADGGKTAQCVVTVSTPQVRTWWGTGEVTINGHDVDIIYSITHNLDKTLTYTVIFGDDTDMIRQVNARSVADVYHNLTGFDSANKTASYTSTTTHSSGEVITGLFYFGVDGVDFTYTVGSSNERPNPSVEGVALNHTTYDLLVDETLQLHATIYPGYAENKAITWSSNNSAIAEVDANGLVTAKAVGTATITVTTADGNKTATCTVTVIAALTESTYYASTYVKKDADAYLGINYSITRTSNRTLLYVVKVNNSEDVDLELNVVVDGNWKRMEYNASANTYTYTTITTYADGDVVSGFFRQIKYGTEGRWDFNYVVGSTSTTPRTMVAVNDEDADLTHLNNGSVYDVILKRNFVMDNDWNTISLPFALTEEQVKEVFGEGTRITKLLSSELKSSTEIDIQFEDVTSIEAATPYLILPKKNVDLGTLIENITINVTPNILEAGITKMIPVLKTENFTGQDNTFFLGANDNLYNRSADGKIKGMRAYFQFSTLTPEQLRNVRARVVFNENVETSVDNLITDEAPVKMIQNGHLIIIRNGIKYNIQGQKL